MSELARVLALLPVDAAATVLSLPAVATTSEACYDAHSAAVSDHGENLRLPHTFPDT